MNRIIVAVFLVVIFVAVALTTTSNAAVPATPTTVQGQSGYWVQVVARDATVRNRPGGSVVKKLTKGQWFHVYTIYGNGAWYLGYACPNGNRGCANRESTPGFILRSALSSNVALTSPAMPGSVGPAFVSVHPEVVLAHAPALSRQSAASFTMFAALQGQERRICAREVWMRNDKLSPIDLLHAGDRFIVERYTDGSKNDGNVRWAIGRARTLRGRVLVSALCR